MSKMVELCGFELPQEVVLLPYSSTPVTIVLQLGRENHELVTFGLVET